MRSIRTKITLLTATTLIITLIVTTVLGVVAINNLGKSNSEQLLLLLCEAGQKNLDAYLGSVEHSVKTVASLVEADLKGITDAQLVRHVEDAKQIFQEVAVETPGIFTYYYRIDPTISKTAKGFWFVNLDGEGFEEHEVTDITLYDVEDTSKLVWFTVPRATKSALWLPPYITDNLDKRVISYNYPIIWSGVFVGVIGIEIDYSMLAEQVNRIKLYEDGYAFLNDEKGNLIYHPMIDVLAMAEKDKPRVPDGLVGSSFSVRYRFDGIDKQGASLPLINGMYLTVTVPISKINRSWQHWINELLIVSAILLSLFTYIILRFSGRITKPLRELTEAAKQVNEGNYDLNLTYDKDDEIGVLTDAFDQLTNHLNVYIKELNSLAFADALTSVRNKGAFDVFMRDLDSAIKNPKKKPAFAIGFFDCDDLKRINDKYGHEKGDLYLKQASTAICHVFAHSPVFRVGGDEFAVLLEHEAYDKRDELVRLFKEKSTQINRDATEKWEEVQIALGVAVFDPTIDRTAEDVIRRADKLMYEEKRKRKASKA